MSRPSTNRVRRHRARQKAGLEVLPVEVDTVHLADVLVGLGFLDPLVSDDRRAIRRALERWLASIGEIREIEV